MPTVLQLQKKKAEAAAAVESARAAITAAKTDAEVAKATAALSTALAEKAEAGFALADMNAPAEPSAKVTHFKVEHKEEKTVETPEKDEEAEDADDKSASDMGGDDKEDDEESKAIAAHYSNASKAIRASGSQSAALYTPSRLLQAVKTATGATTLKGAFGALAAMGERIAKVEKTEGRIAALEAKNTAHEVDRLIASAKKAGKIVGKAHEQDMRAQGVQQGPAWLEGRLANMPKVAQTVDTGGLVSAEASGTISGVAGLTRDQQRMLEAFTAGKTPEQIAAFKAAMLANINPGAVAPTH